MSTGVTSQYFLGMLGRKRGFEEEMQKKKKKTKTTFPLGSDLIWAEKQIP